LIGPICSELFCFGLVNGGEPAPKAGETEVEVDGEALFHMGSSLPAFF
jgi:hypothetical protein